MTIASAHLAPETLDALAERCLALGCPAVFLDSDGAIAHTPDSLPLVAQLVAARPMRRLLAGAAEHWAAQAEPAAALLFEGAWAIPEPITQRRRRVGYLAAIYLTPASLEAPQFREACEAARLDEADVRASLAGCAAHEPGAIERAAEAVRLAHSDLVARAAASESLAGFSRQLSESYEEINFLYKLGASMNQIVQPERFVRLVCEELHATLAFRWVGVAFAGDGAGSIAGRTFHAGENSEPLLRPALLRLLRLADPAKERVIPLGEVGPEFGPATGEAIVQPVARDGRLLGVIVAGDKRGDDPHVSSVDTKLVSAAASYLAIHLENAGLYEDQQSMFLGTLKALTASIDAKDRYTRGHSERVAHLTRELARRAGLDEETLERVHIAGLVHDVGKIGVPESVLRKPGALTDAEFALIKLHPEIGHNILKDIPQLADVLPGVLHHHERWDGRGYPHGLRAEATPLVARLIALADSFDAMSSSRTYRPAMDRARVFAEIRKGAGVQFDPDLAARFVTLDFDEYDSMVARHVDQEQGGGAPLGAAA